MTEPSREAMKALNDATRAHDRLSAHETLCDQRWGQLNRTVEEMKESVRRLYNQQWKAAGAVIAVLLAAVAFLYGKLP